jgi:hypothetical protein
MTIVVIGPNCWGKGSTIQEAWKNAKWLKRHDPYVVFAGNATKVKVDEIGVLSWSGGNLEQIGEFNVPRERRGDVGA